MRPMRRHDAGFTLVEAVIVVAITGAIAAIVSLFIVAPVRAYLDTAARARLVDEADRALRQVGRELRRALPNSVRVSGSGRSIEWVPSAGAARYVTQGEQALRADVNTTRFNVLGPGLDLPDGAHLVFYNLGAGVSGADVYAANDNAGLQAASNRRSATSAAGSVSTLDMQSLAPLPAVALTPPYRVFATTQPVSYHCNLAAGTLTRHSGYGFLAMQAEPPTGGQQAVVAAGVVSCQFSLDGTLVAAQAGLVELHLSLAAQGMSGPETVQLRHAIHVDNLP